MWVNDPATYLEATKKTLFSSSGWVSGVSKSSTRAAYTLENPEPVNKSKLDWMGCAKFSMHSVKFELPSVPLMLVIYSACLLLPSGGID